MEREIKHKLNTTPGMSLSHYSKQIENKLRQVDCKLKQEIRNLTICPNCSNLFSIENPAVILECGHTACKCCYYNFKRDGKVCWKQCEPAKQGQLVINHQIQDNLDLLRHADNTSTLTQLGVPESLQCYATKKHLLLPSESVVQCDNCHRKEICLRCEDCNMNFCLTCKEHSLKKKKCLYGHSLQYKTEKTTCIGCNKEANCIFTCQTCPTYQICYECEGFINFQSKVCPNGKELKFIEEEKTCILCKNPENGFYCLCCDYFLCTQSCSKPKEINQTLNVDFTYSNIVSTLTGHTNCVESIIKLNETEIASASRDKTIKIWNVKTQECVNTLTGHTDTIHSIIKLNESEIASTSLDSTVKIWSVEKKECVITLIGHTSWVISIAKLNENEIASGSRDKTIKIWNVKKKECVHTLSGHTDSVYSIIKLNENEIASSGFDTTIKVWNVKKQQCKITLTGHTSWVESIIKLTENEIASASWDSTIKIWNLDKKKCVITLIGHTSCVLSIIKLNETEIASASADKTIKIWNVEKEECVITLTGHTNTVFSIIKLNENEIASSSRDETIKIWKLNKI